MTLAVQMVEQRPAIDLARIRPEGGDREVRVERLELAAPGGEEAGCGLGALGFGQALAAEADAGA